MSGEQTFTNGRSTFPDLVAADKAFDEAAATTNPERPSHYAPMEEWKAFYSKVDELRAARQAEEVKVADQLCRKCDGKGRIIGYSHRSHGLCYSCNGDGFTAKGRRAYRTRQAELAREDQDVDCL